jgi:hypothetical protein
MQALAASWKELRARTGITPLNCVAIRVVKYPVFLAVSAHGQILEKTGLRRHPGNYSDR